MPEKNFLSDTMSTGDGAQYLSHEVVVKLNDGYGTETLLQQVMIMGGTLVDLESPLTLQLGYYRIQLPEDVFADEAISHLVAQGVAS